MSETIEQTGRLAEGELGFLAGVETAEPPRVMIVSPHPDDEVIGFGTRLRLFRDVLVVEVTDGAPRNGFDAQENGFSDWGDYARARKEELMEALQVGGGANLVNLDVPDQEASFHLAAIARRLQALIETHRPQYLLTLPYEGGHPDHDATAFAAHSAVGLTEVWKRPVMLEMAAYHKRGECCAHGEFLSESGSELALHLTPEECGLKRRMLECFRTQRKVLQWVPIGMERFREAPRYDFRSPPHAGALYYEGFPWGMHGERWRHLARIATEELAVQSEPCAVV